MKNGMKIT